MAIAAACMAAACTRPAPAPAAGAPTPVYSKTDGHLEQLISDRNGDGKPDTWAFMDGTRIVRIEIDRNGDGKPDRWEYYSQPRPDGSPTIIERIEEANGADAARITRRERYSDGELQSVEDDTDDDGRPDKWEHYEAGRLAYVDLDLEGQGRPTERLVYGDDGSVATVEAPENHMPLGNAAIPTERPRPAKGGR